MTNISTIKVYLESKLYCPVYINNVPETETGDSVSVYNSGVPTPNRDMEGRKIGRSLVWRVEVVANSNRGVQSILDELEELDNSTSLDYQRIFVQLINYEHAEPDQTYQRAFVDITVYDR